MVLSGYVETLSWHSVETQMKIESFDFFFFSFLCRCFSVLYWELTFLHPHFVLIFELRDYIRSCFFPRYPKDVQETLVQNVFLTGGNTMYPGMKARMEKELLEMRPFQSSFQVLIICVVSYSENSITCFLISKVIIMQKYPLLTFLWLFFWS